MSAKAEGTWAAHQEWALFVVSTGLLLAGGGAWLASASTAASVLWIAGTVLGLVFWWAGPFSRSGPAN